MLASRRRLAPMDGPTGPQAAPAGFRVSRNGTGEARQSVARRLSLTTSRRNCGTFAVGCAGLRAWVHAGSAAGRGTLP
jgi:hypothetical protein